MADKKKPDKPVDPNEENAKLHKLKHRVGMHVHAALNKKGGVGYRGTVKKITDTHTFVDIGNKKMVKAPHHLVTLAKSIHEETKEQKKERLKNEAKRETRSFRDYKELENSIENREGKSKRHHEHERKVHREEDETNKTDIKKTYTSLGAYMRRRAEAARKAGNHDDAKKKDMVAAHWERMANEETDWDSTQKKEREVQHYHVVSRSTGKVVGKAATKKRARSIVDKRDNEYGGYNHQVVPVFKEETNSEKRMKEPNIGRPDSPSVTSKQSVLHKTQQIQKKIIDEDYQMKLFDVSKDVLDTIKNVTKKAEVQVDEALNGNMKDMPKTSGGYKTSTNKNNKETTSSGGYKRTAPKPTEKYNKSGFSPKNEETSLVSKILNKYNK